MVIIINGLDWVGLGLFWVVFGWLIIWLYFIGYFGIGLWLVVFGFLGNEMLFLIGKFMY